MQTKIPTFEQIHPKYNICQIISYKFFCHCLYKSVQGFPQILSFSEQRSSWRQMNLHNLFFISTRVDMSKNNDSEECDG